MNLKDGGLGNFLKSLNQIANNTQFNGVKLLNGSFVNKEFQVGAYAGQTVGVSVLSVATQKLGHLTETKSAAKVVAMPTAEA